jgi:hypothetical protein
MMNYKGWAIPEGNVVKVEDAAGNVLWKQAPSGATVTITKTLAGYEPENTGGYVTIDGVDYKTSTSLVVPLGTVIVCSAPWTSHYMYGSFGGQISLNGNLVANRVTGVAPTIYEYAVNGDVQIELKNVGSPAGIFGNIFITEL